MTKQRIYIVEKCGYGRFDVPVFVDAYILKQDAIDFVVKKNSSNNTCYVYSFRAKVLK